MMPYATGSGASPPGSRSCGPRAWARTVRARRPSPASGPVDQHSQLQLFMDGPREHLITVVRAPSAGTGPRIDAGTRQRRAGLGYLAGRTAGDLVAAQAEALPEALARAGRPVRTFDLARLDEASLGALMMHMMLETILAARPHGGGSVRSAGRGAGEGHHARARCGDVTGQTRRRASRLSPNVEVGADPSARVRKAHAHPPAAARDRQPHRRRRGGRAAGERGQGAGRERARRRRAPTSRWQADGGGLPADPGRRRRRAA